jgi:hypothetical protein
MATQLAQVSVVARKIIRWGIFLILFLIVGRILWGAGVSAYKKLFPAPPDPPTITFGKLTKLPFPESTRPGGITFTLENPEGTLPTLPFQMKVYFMPKVSSHLLSLEVAKQKASSLGYLADELAISETVYRFAHKNGFANLQINIVSGVFSLGYDLKGDTSPLSTRPPNPEVAAALVRSFLSTADLLAADLTGPTTHQFLKVDNEQLVGALSLSDASLIKIYLFRKNYEDYPSLTPYQNQSNVWFIVSGSQETDKKIIGGEYHYFPVDETQFATYPIKTAQAAWDELIAGGGYIVNSGGAVEGGNVKIRKIYLGYYDAGLPVEFFQPIIVFEGDNGFKAYIPAITSDYYGE